MMNRLYQSLTALLLIGGMALSPMAATAQSTAEDERQAETRLILETNQIEPGQNVWAAVEFTIDPEWHIYWRNPGDSGLAPTIKWSLPEGFETGPLQWQPPKRIHYDELVNYGYDGTTALLTPLIVPEQLGTEDIVITAQVDYLICKDVCIPESATLTATLTPQSAATKPADTNLTELMPYLERLPVPFPGQASYIASAEGIDVNITFSEIDELLEAFWYPIDDGVMKNNRDPIWFMVDNTLTIRAPRGNIAKLPDTYRGLVKLLRLDGAAAQYYYIDAALNHEASVLELPKAASTPQTDEPLATDGATSDSDDANVNDKAPVAADPAAADAFGMSFGLAILFALLGGIVLNIMPCVLPVLSLKAFSIAQKTSSAAARKSGIAYTSGVLLSFAAIGGLLIVIQQAGGSIGWGFQLQSPVFVTFMIYLLMAIGFSLSGFYYVSAFGTRLAERTSPSDSLGNSFFTGILATLLATPCTAPFMAGALGFALTQPPAGAMLIFLSLGFGLALPYLLICFSPALRRFLPKPGRWMESAKELLAFPIYATAAWLLWVLVQQTGSEGLALALAGIILIAFAIWLTRRMSAAPSRIFILLLALLVLGWSLYAQGALVRGMVFGLTSPSITEKPEDKAEAMLFSLAAIEEARAANRPVFVNATAAWCLTCKVNERVALRDEEVAAAFAKHNVAYFVADWTNRDAAITDYLRSFNRNGVPIYVYYAPGKEPQLLPQLLTPGTLLELFEKAD